MNGPPTGTAGDLFTWTAMGEPTADSLSYQYQWRVNGQDVPDATHSQYLARFPAPGSYEISVVMTYSDYSTVTPMQMHTSVFGVRVSGPGSLEEYTSGTWTADVPGGAPPYTYAWTLDGAYAGGGTSSLDAGAAWGGGEEHTVGLTVTDAEGRTASGSQSVYVYFTGGLPDVRPATLGVPRPTRVPVQKKP